MTEWIPFKYRDFYDVPRAVVAWIDCFKGESHTGPIWLNRSVAIDEIAVYQRENGSQALKLDF